MANRHPIVDGQLPIRDRYPQLREDYFKNYKRIIYLAQNELTEYQRKAERIAEYLNLPLEIRNTGYGMLEQRLVEIMEQK